MIVIALSYNLWVLIKTEAAYMKTFLWAYKTLINIYKIPLTNKDILMMT